MPLVGFEPTIFGLKVRCRNLAWLQGRLDYARESTAVRSASMRVAVILAGGSGQRSGADQNKALVEVAGVTVLRRSVDAMLAGGVDAIVVVARSVDHDAIAHTLSGVEYAVVGGGKTRQRSESAGIAAAAELGATGVDDVIAIHDAARPLVDAETVRAVFDAAAVAGAAYPAIELHGVWHVSAPTGAPSEPRQAPLLAAQTPQAARANLLVAAMSAGGEAAGQCTDTIDLLARFGAADHRVAVVAGDARNLKLTWPADFVAAERLLADASSDEIRPVQSSTVQPTDAPTTVPSLTSADSVDLYAALTEVELQVADVQVASECLAGEGTDICATCEAAEVDGSLAARPALARCVTAKRGG